MGALLHNVEAEVGEDGCLVVTSGAVGLGYGPQDAENRFRGRFVTSDLVELKGRETFLRGRLGDLINVAGRKLNPTLVEQELLKHPDILGCVVFGAPGDCRDRGDTVVACYHSRVALTGQQLRGFLLGRLTAWQLPREWWAVDSVAANLRGKTPRSEWRKRYLDEKGRRAGR